MVDAAVVNGNRKERGCPNRAMDLDHNSQRVDCSSGTKITWKQSSFFFSCFPLSS